MPDRTHKASKSPDYEVSVDQWSDMNAMVSPLLYLESQASLNNLIYNGFFFVFEGITDNKRQMRGNGDPVAIMSDHWSTA